MKKIKTEHKYIKEGGAQPWSKKQATELHCTVGKVVQPTLSFLQWSNKSKWTETVRTFPWFKIIFGVTSKWQNHLA